MAARWSALVLACQLLLAAGLGVAVAMKSTIGDLASAALAIVALCGVALLLAAAPLTLGLSLVPDRGPRRRAGHTFRALCSDARALEIALGRMALEPFRAAPETAVAGSPWPARPVLLVHGFGCSRAVWRPLLSRLRAMGIGPVRAVSLEPLLADIETNARKLLRELESLKSRAGGKAIAVVAHSMGGLVVRAALRRSAPGLIGRIITIGAPHHGTAVACWFRWRSTRQMCPGSSWLGELNACQEGRLGIPVTTLYSLDDNYIVPAESARLDGARAIELEGLGHLALLDSKTVLEHVISELLQ